MAKLRQFSHFLQQINKWEPFPFCKNTTLELYYVQYVTQKLFTCQCMYHSTFRIHVLVLPVIV